MRITLLGTGGPRPDPTRQGPATLVETEGLKLLFDAGRGVATQLAKAQIHTRDLDAVFITHHHFDHIGGLGDLLMAAWNAGRDRPLRLYGPQGLGEIVSGIFDRVYARDIAFRIAEGAELGHVIDPPGGMVEIREVTEEHIDLAMGVHVVVGQVEHGSRALGLSDAQWVALGYRIESEGAVVAFSGDAVPGIGLNRLASEADVLVMCAYLSAEEITTEEEIFLTERILAGAPQAGAVAATAGVRRLVLTHIREKPDAEVVAMVRHVSQTFSGDVVAGHDLMAIDI